MSTITLRVFVLLFLTQALLGQAGLVQETRLVIEGATLIDGTDRPAIPDSIIVKNPRPQGGVSNTVTFFVAP